MLRRKNVEIPLYVHKECILLMHLQKTLHFAGMLSVLAGMPWSNEPEDHCLPGVSGFLSIHRAVLRGTWSEHARSKRPHDLESARRRQRWRRGCSCCQNWFIWLIVFLTSPQHGAWNIWSRTETTWTSFIGQLRFMCHQSRLHVLKYSVFWWCLLNILIIKKTPTSLFLSHTW